MTASEGTITANESARPLAVKFADWGVTSTRSHQGFSTPLWFCVSFSLTGFTTTTVSAHRDHTRESTAQNARSTGRSRGRGAARRNTASCFRRARFSATRLARGRRAARSAAAIEESRAITAAPLPSSASASCRRHGPARRGHERGGELGGWRAQTSRRSAAGPKQRRAFSVRGDSRRFPRSGSASGAWFPRSTPAIVPSWLRR